MMFNIVNNKPIYIESGSKVIIRNWWTGFTLHSHDGRIKSNNEQEVTCYSHPRDCK